MDSSVRKKRTLAERRESDKLRQRRFRAKKREEARMMQSVNGPVEKEKKERVYSLPKKTADEIRATNRLRQQRFRAKRRGELVSVDPVMSVREVKPDIHNTFVEVPELIPEIPEDPAEMIQRVLLEAATDEKNRQTEIRREKDRIRKRRERQRKKDRALRLAGLTPTDVMKQRFQKKIEYFEKDMEKVQNSAPISLNPKIDEEDEEVDYDDFDDEEVAGILSVNGQSTTENNDEGEEYFDASQFMAQLQEMGLVLDVAASSDGGSPVLEIKQKPQEETSEESTSSSPTNSTLPDLYPFLEKKPWQRCHTAEERRERERMRKRMYRAKQRYISTGKLEMQWDPTLIKRSPTDDREEGITPLPPWHKSMSPEQKLEAHRIYNRRYRERLRKDTSSRDETSRRTSREASIGESSSETGNDGGVSSEIFNAMLSTMTQKFDFSNMLLHNQVNE